MLHPNDHEWRRRAVATGASVTRPATDDPEGIGPAPALTPAEETHACPVCAFASDDHDDVYAHLMTAHRKSTISAALLEQD